MPWTVVDDDGVIQIRASINTKTQQDELLTLIEKLQKRLDLLRAIDQPKEATDV